MIGTCGAAGCIDSASVAAIFAVVMGCWAIGFGIGKSVAWVRKIANVS